MIVYLNSYFIEYYTQHILQNTAKASFSPYSDLNPS